MFLLVSVLHVGAHPDELQQGVSIQSSINLGKTFPRISRIWVIPSTQILARVFVYLPPFISQILDFIWRMVLIFILIYFGWRDIENNQLDAFFSDGARIDLSTTECNGLVFGKSWNTWEHKAFTCVVIKKASLKKFHLGLSTRHSSIHS